MHSPYFATNLGYSSLIQHPYNLKELYKSAWSATPDRSELLHGSLNCYASHCLLWLECIKANRSMVILEDDACLEPRFSQSVLDCLNGPFDFVRLWALFGEKRPQYSEIGAHEGRKLVMPTKYEHLLLMHFYLTLFVPICSVAYYITPKAAKAFVSASLYFNQPVDIIVNQTYLHHIPALTYIPISVSLHPNSANSNVVTEPNTPAQLKRYPLKDRLLAKIRRERTFAHFAKLYAHLV
ncbi:glycosyltransferase family 25 protein [Helicobacter heilmannii]|nr:glycosyltransferase family 25 protein [Helicobacter heilmannii]